MSRLLMMLWACCCHLNIFSQGSPLFKQVSASVTGLNFENKLVESPQQNIITYEYFYNGGGVGAGDFNNDGLIDLYFTSNQQPNKLFLNKGNFRFEDITKQAGVAGYNGWKTGVSVADVNGDGLLDIYVCYSGDVEREERRNQLFINNGNLTFTDKAAVMGLADEGHTTMAAFFDYDRDGDLDCYVMNHNIKNLRNFDAAFVKKMVDPDAGDRLYKNTNNHFNDITQQAGIRSNPLGYGLGININDVNNDGWPDIYICNDYVEEDYLYINNKQGGFNDELKNQLGHISNFSMGVDIADINNDGLSDIVTLDMLPEDNRRQKLIYAPDNYELYENQLQNGFYHQLMRNMLHINKGNSSFAEVGQAAGISATDWSWSALLFDFNNDGRRDLFVTNGYGRDMINRDFMKFYANERLRHLQGKTDSRMFQMLQGIQSTPLHNYIFQNNGGWQFTDRSTEWGFSEADFAHGAICADLDNDGDLDVVTNRMNAFAGVYVNQSVELGAQPMLYINLKGKPGNNYAIGASIKAYYKESEISTQQYPVHGFQSSMQMPVCISAPAKIDSLSVFWPDGSSQKIINPVFKDRSLTVDYKPAATKESAAYTSKIFKPAASFPFNHAQPAVNDFKIQPLMPAMLSYTGPKIARADINGDGLEDVFICGAKGQAGQLMQQQQNGAFIKVQEVLFAADADAEDCDAVFFDADGDKDADLYVVSGGYAAGADDLSLQDRLYINNNGSFIKSASALPVEKNAGSCVIAFDFDADGDLDLFCGSRSIPGQYPVAENSVLLQNNGDGKFTDVTDKYAPQLRSPGMLTAAIANDMDGDGKPELILAGDFLSLRCYRFNKGVCTEVTSAFFPEQLYGSWNTIKSFDMDGDGDLDIVAGNWGNNSSIKVSATQPATLYYADFDDNSYIDPLLTYYIMGKEFPMASRDELTDQIVSMRQKFPTYDAYANATITDILNEEQLNKANKLKLNYLNTCWFKNEGGTFLKQELPPEASYAPVCALYSDDFDKDGNKDLLLAGNVYASRIKLGRMDANSGVLLKGDGKGNFTYVPQTKSGLNLQGCIRDIIPLKNGDKGNTLLISVNNGYAKTVSY